MAGFAESGSSPSVPSTAAASAPSAADPMTASAASSANRNLASEQTGSTSTTIGSMSELRTKSPKMYNFMMLSIAQNICMQLSRRNDKLIQEMKKARQNSNS